LPSFDFVCEELDPLTAYKVRMVRVTGRGGTQSGSVYPFAYSDRTFTGSNQTYEIQVTSDSNGRIEGVLNPTSSDTAPSLYYHNDRYYSNSNQWLDVSGNPDPNREMVGRVADAGGRQVMPSPWGDFDALPVKQEVIYYLQVTNIFNNPVLSSNITTQLGYAVDVSRSGFPSALPFGELVIPANLNLQTQFWTPVLDQNCDQPVPSEPFGYTDLIKRDFATADTRNVQIHTLEIFCEKDPLNETYFLCNDTQSHELMVDGVTQTFQAANFSFTLPQTTEDSTPEMQLTISNLDGVAGEYIDRVRGFGTVAVRYCVYLASDPTQSQNPNPLTLYLTEANVDMFQISGRLSLTDSLDARFPSENYNVKNFPNIFG
jgi:hypothetical protein